ncbi:glycoside hydrolase superfamily [Mycena amicta]|nr:glycoside hydrolase superfamily [Mycena amicta]
MLAHSTHTLTTLSLLLSVSSAVAGGRDFVRVRRAPAKANNSLVQLFEWPWDSVAAECTSFIGPFGYGFVQVSPPTEHITGTQWWTDYQPVSYNITSKRGTREQFASMVKTCQSAGVGIVADVVLNHMTGGGKGTGIAGTSFSKYDYSIYSEDNFHYCDGSEAADITNFQNLTQVRTCELVGLSDLAQEQPEVQAKMVAYLNDLLSLGVAGFRVDAARHMDPANLKTIFSQLNGSPYITQEVSSGGASSPPEFLGNGDIIAFVATTFIRDAFTGASGSVSNLVTPVPMNTAWNLVASSSANVIMANQDTERSGGSLTSTSANNAYTLSAIFLLGFNYGTPTVYSGYDFDGNFDLGAPQDASGKTNAVTCFENVFRCEHRFIAIANMNLFHNAVGSADLTNVAVGTTQQVAFGRGSKGFLVINNDKSAWNTTFSTSLPAGDYCDIIHDTDTDPTTCSGPKYTVSDAGKFTASVGAFDALALYTT